MGLLAPRPCCPEDVPADVTVRAVEDADWRAVRRIYGEGVPSRSSLDARWLPGHRWVAERAGEVVGWTALTPVSTRESYAGVAESVVYVAEAHRGQGIGKALIRQQVIAADNAGLWTLQAEVLAENRAAIALHHAAGYRTVGVRERIARVNGTWHDTVLVERRADAGRAKVA
jgi:L-amino acid N-acyltransferase YncA